MGAVAFGSFFAPDFQTGVTSTFSPVLLLAEQLNKAGLCSEHTKCPADELIKHLFSGFQLLTMTRLARTT